MTASDDIAIGDTFERLDEPGAWEVTAQLGDWVRLERGRERLHTLAAALLDATRWRRVRAL